MTDTWKAPEPIASEVIDWLYSGRALLTFCEKPGMPSRRTIYNWVDRDPEFGAQFARARESGAGVLVDMAQKVADEADADNVQVAKLRVDTLFKRAACFAPKLYGTKVQLGGDGGAPIRVEATGPVPPQGIESYLSTLQKAVEAHGEHDAC